jgi:4,5-dihydroxyphthalate decarboxylase
MELTIALNRYDRHVPFFNGTLALPANLSFRPLEVGESAAMRDGIDRHARMLNHGEFDVGEVSLSSYIMAVARDPDHAAVGVATFPRRFFSAGQLYVNVESGIETPADLIGRKVGLHSFQTTLSVLAKGDLKLDYGIDWRDIDWVCMRGETIPVDLGDASVSRMADGADMGKMLIDGEVEALFSPHPPKSMLAEPDRTRRLFRDARAEELRYYRKYGFYPIMHIMTLRRELADAHPALPRQIMDIWDQAKRLTYNYYDDSNYSLLAWSRNAYEEQREVLGDDPWPSGLAANRKNLEQFISYSHDQRLIAEPIPVESLFHETVLDS